ncbi:class I fructose-bisphosphate aldolase [Actinoplanes friuliensis]|jgi:DhnA family fructose-bisphosphate aldolase class Ia|uniref:Fructose-bisphosphate aldolase n=1 Tax=Actinoplanes friuliensis DSM 7358 TaxID=1246995 RepID=U5WAL3_9ACTN|nr:fructose-bisphosphate aldolase [Actinoplanes friuliensis]AGZ45030.1 Fructose-bisphosphate aldolase [Actinoplanes friuliensis DSM 7358]
MDSRTGKKIRLGRLLDPRTGRAVVVAASHGVMSGPPAGLRTRAEIETAFSKMGTADGVMVSPGMLPLLEDFYVGRGRPALVLHLDWKNHGRKIYTPGQDGRGEGVLAQLASLEDVAAAGVDAVMTYLYIGQRNSELERAEIERNARIVADAAKVGVAVIIEPRSALEAEGPEALSTEVLSLYCRISADIGADLVKVLWNGSVEAFAPVAQTCYAPILVAGGPGGEDEKDTLQLAADSIEAGAAGVMFGRRVFRAERPEAVLAGLRAVTHDGVSVDEALARL